jgi:hypothetical protein
MGGTTMQSVKILTAGLLAIALPDIALACGGFFCSQTPIDQSAERIIFAVDKDEGTITTHVQINYQGAAENFAWVVPTPSLPELFLSTDQLFTQLGQSTRPQFYLNYEYEGECMWPEYDYYDDDCFNCGPSPSSADASGSEESVEVIQQAQVGPFETAILKADSSSALLQWLQDNGYDLPDNLQSVLDPYVLSDSHFVALRLQSDKDAGDIEPLGMTYIGNKPMIPIQLTSIAATPDMRLEVYVLGDARAAPQNFLHVTINEAAIDWLSGGSNYEQVVTDAANEAGGHAFATDFAGSTEQFEGLFYDEGRFNLVALEALTDITDVVPELLQQGFPRNTVVQDILRDHIPAPQALLDEGISERQWFNNMWFYEEYITQTYLDSINFDAEALADDLQAFVVEPLMRAEHLVQSHSYLTRLTSSMSPEEMTLDPVFLLNADLADQDNVHRATLVIECGNELYFYENAPRRLELSSGRVILLEPLSTQVGSYLEDLEEPAAATIEQTADTGVARVLVDNRDEIDSNVEEHNERVRGTGGVCGAAQPHWLMLWTALSGFALTRRRRR